MTYRIAIAAEFFDCDAFVAPDVIEVADGGCSADARIFRLAAKLLLLWAGDAMLDAYSWRCRGMRTLPLGLHALPKLSHLLTSLVAGSVAGSQCRTPEA